MKDTIAYWGMTIALCFLPIAIALYYFVGGLRLYVRGKKSNSRFKVMSGANAMAYALLAIVFIIFIWKWIGPTLISWL